MLKFYNSGKEFLQDNSAILDKYPLETVFFDANAKFMMRTDKNDFLVKVVNDDKFLIAVHNKDFPMVIFGSVDLCRHFAQVAVAEKLTFTKVLGTEILCEVFLKEYKILTGATFEVNHAMDIMCCNNVLTTDVDGVETPTKKDANQLARMLVDFSAEALGHDAKIDEVENDVVGRLSSFAVFRKDNRIVSLAAIKRETDKLASIADVYTLSQYRGKGLSCKVVTYLTKKILDSGKLPYLFVDKTNPISNHLYLKIGYTYATPQYEYKINIAKNE